MSDLQRIRDYYASFDEWRRLESPAGRLEFRRTTQILESHIASSAHVLDLGGGPGRYTIHLAKTGRTVALTDVSSDLIEQATIRIEEANVSDRVSALNISCATSLKCHADAQFDGVICLGPFYHLTDTKARHQACSEIFRVLKPGGKAIVGFIPRLSGLVALLDRASYAPGQVNAENFLNTAHRGKFQNNSQEGFQCGYYAPTQVIKTLFEESGFCSDQVLSIRGIAYGREAVLEKLNQESPELRKAIEKTLIETATRTEIIELCGHALYIGHKPIAQESREPAQL